MADFKLANANAKEVWSTKFAKEYVSESGFLPFMSTADNAIIRVNTDLANKGDLVHIPYIASLKGSGVTGGATLEGNEEALLNYSTAIKVKHVRNAVILAESETFRSEVDYANSARGGLKEWSAERLRDDLIGRLQDVPVAGGNDADGTPVEDTYKSFATSTAGEKNSYLTANQDRVLMGTAKATAPTNFGTSIAAVPGTATLSAATVTKAKQMAMTTTQFRITPYRTKGGQKWYVMFVGVEGFNQLSADERIEAANRDARVRGMDNPLFNGDDLVWDGVIIKLIPEIAQVGNLGASSAPIGFAALCGANTLGVAFSRKPTFRSEVKDYEHKVGIGISEIRGVSKMSATGVQTGQVSIYYAA